MLTTNIATLTTSVASLTAAYTILAATKNTNQTTLMGEKRSGGTTADNKHLHLAVGRYCWTHGYCVSKGHDSATCSNKAEGHKDTATRANTMNGSKANKGWEDWRDTVVLAIASNVIDTNLTCSLATAATAANTCSPLRSPHQQSTAIIDTGASDHYFTAGAPALDFDPNAPKTTILMATREARTSTGAAVLAIPGIPSRRA